jgi:transcriptional regulator with XRE-family HTH domain
MTMLLERKLLEGRMKQSLPVPDVRRLLRKNAGLTQHDIAEIVGVDRAAVTRWESGLRAPRGANALAYAGLLERLAREALEDGDPAATPGLPNSAGAVGEDGHQG